MLGRLREGLSRVADTLSGTSKVVPPVLALLALVVFAWIVAGIFVGGPADDGRVANRPDLPGAEDPVANQDPLAPEVENRNAESYAAYQSKDPFRQLLTPPEPENAAGGGGDTAGRDGAAAASPDPAVPGPSPGADSDGDGLDDSGEVARGLDPVTPDTDGDGILDGDESEGAGANGAPGGGPSGPPGADHAARRTDDLFGSGGDLPLP